MRRKQVYPIGIPGVKWQEQEKTGWLKRQSAKRSYRDDVIAKLLPLERNFELVQYGILSHDVGHYPLFALKTPDFDKDKPCILVTGGVHGYETSGVQGVIRFIETQSQEYGQHFNILAVPCVSPWGYETINRWNPKALDPNRSFYANSPAEESAALMQYLASLELDVFAHIDFS